METKTEKGYVLSIVAYHKKHMHHQLSERIRASIKTMYCFMIFAPSKVAMQKSLVLSQMQRRRKIKNELNEIHNELNKKEYVYFVYKAFFNEELEVKLNSEKELFDFAEELYFYDNADVSEDEKKGFVMTEDIAIRAIESDNEYRVIKVLKR